MHTQILDVDGALIPHTSVVNGHLRPIGYSRAITALCDPQAMDGELGRLCDLLVDLCCGAIGADSDGFGEVLDRTAWTWSV